MASQLNNQRWLKQTVLTFSCVSALSLMLGAGTPQAKAVNIGSNIAMGYWDNWGTFTLQSSPSEYKVLFYAFAEGSGTDGATIFMYQPSSTNPLSNLQSDVAACHTQGRKVVLSIGGANSPNITLQNTTDVNNFVGSVENLVSTYGFDGIDLDLENSSLTVNSGDNINNPGTPDEYYMGQALQQLASHFGQNFLITMVPETADIDGYGTYGGIWGSYIPLISANRSIISLVDTQCYNSGSMYAANGQVVAEGGADFDVAMSELLLHGYTLNGGQNFAPLAQQQVAFGSLVGTNSPSTAVSAWNYLTKGQSDGGSYFLLGGPYGSMAGMMVWDINSDVAQGSPWANAFAGAGLNGTANGGTTGGTTGGGTVSNGIHTLTPQCAPSTRLDDSGGSTANGNKIQIWQAAATPNQQWNFSNIGGNNYNLAVNLGPYCLDSNGGAAGTPVHLWSCGGYANQQWTVNSVSGGYELVNAAGNCLDDSNFGTSNGNTVQSWTCSGNSAQTWMLDYTPPTISNGVHTLTPQCATGSRLDDAGGGTANGNTIQIWQAAGNVNQQWNFNNIGGNTFNIAVNLGPYCLDSNGGASGTAVHLWSCGGYDNQKWTAIAQQYGFQLQNAAGNCLDVAGASSANGTVVQNYTCNGNDNAQVWAVN